MLAPQVVVEAAERLHGIANQTPVFTSRTLNERVNGQVLLKGEHLQRVGAFKFRGAYNAVSQMDPAARAVGVVTHSSGNHAQGLALAAKLCGAPATIVMPDDAPAVKKAATAGYGATIVECPGAERERVSDELAREHGYTLVHPYDHDHIIAGAGTAAYELFAEVGDLDYLLTPVGGGGLISGSALGAAAQCPTCKVVGVEPETAADANRSWRSGEIETLAETPPTIADGLRTRFIGERNHAIMQHYLHDMMTVSEEEIIRTLKFIWERMKILIEPSSAVAIAPLFTGKLSLDGERVGVIISGGNVDIRQVARLFAALEG